MAAGDRGGAAAQQPRVLFVHGGGDGAYEADRPLAESLSRALGGSHTVFYPPMPAPGAPSYAAWRDAIVHALEPLGDGVVLAGHSLGGSVLLKCLAEGRATRSVRALFMLAAPYWSAGGWDVPEFAVQPEAALRLDRELPIILQQCRDDEEVPLAHLELYRALLPRATVLELERGGHQLGDDISALAQRIRALSAGG